MRTRGLRCGLLNTCIRRERVFRLAPHGCIGTVCWPQGPRQFSAWLGLTPLQNSRGGKERLGRISKMGDKYLRSQALTAIPWCYAGANSGVGGQASGRRTPVVLQTGHSVTHRDSSSQAPSNWHLLLHRPAWGEATDT
jgi:hypothetical protein